jgi:Arc/MetJ family transcription regulator
MLLCVRTTIDLPDALLTEARQQALAEGTTLRALVAEALRARLEGDSPPSAVGIEVEVYGGSGLAEGVTEADLFTREERNLPGAWPDDPGPGAAPDDPGQGAAPQ